jgi:O-antigen ligase
VQPLIPIRERNLNGNAKAEAKRLIGNSQNREGPVIRGARGVSKARFNAAHVAWAAMFCSILIWGFRDARAAGLGDTGNWYRIALVLFAGILGMYAVLRNTSRLARGFDGPLLLFLLYGLLAMISSAYIPTYSLYSMWKGLEVVIDVIVIAAVITYPEPIASARLAYKILIALFGMLLLTYSIEALVVPSAALAPSRGFVPFTMSGVLPIMNGNALAFLSAVVAFGAFCNLLRTRNSFRRVLALIIFAWTMTVLILAQSRTSLVGLVVAICAFLLLDRRFGWLALIVALTIMVAALTSFVDVAQQYVIRGQSKELFTSLSGRTQAWEAAWRLFLQSPLFGHGFAAAARVEILGTGGRAASTLHGSIFDVMVGVGLLGLLPWAAAILWTMVLAFRSARRGQAMLRNAMITRSSTAEMSGLLLLILVRGSTSSGLAMHDHDFMLFLTVVAFFVTASRAALRPGPAALASRSHPSEPVRMPQGAR